MIQDATVNQHQHTILLSSSKLNHYRHLAIKYKLIITIQI